MKIILYLYRRAPLPLVAAIIAGVISGISNTALLALINDLVTGAGRLVSENSQLLAYAVLCLVVVVTRLLSGFLLVRIGQRLVESLRIEMSQRIISTPLARIEKLGSGKLLATLTTDIGAISTGMIQVPTLAVASAIVASCMVYMVWLSWQLFLIFLAVFAVGVVTYQVPTIMGMRRFEAAREDNDVLMERFRDLVEGFQELKLHRLRSADFVDQVGIVSRRLYSLTLSAMTIFIAAATWGNVLIFVVIGLLLLVAPGFFTATPEVILGYTLALLYLMNPLQGMLTLIPMLGQAAVSVHKVESLRLSLDAGALANSPREIGESFGDWQHLKLDGISYLQGSGDDAFQLGPVDLTLQRGEVVFLVGGNGSGKTTLARVLMGLYEPSGGSLSLGDFEVTAQYQDDYRQLFSAVFATPYLFETLLGLQGDGLDDRAASYLEELDLGDKVKVEEGRLSTLALSQGQRKRLALMVAYLEDRPIYLFDEWAADQDPSYREIFYTRILPELKSRGKTVLVISHDDRYYSAADRILRLDYGKLTYDGPFADSPYAAAQQARSLTAG
ncbi:MAG: cyclic peptide export ABC transporter [Acidobacteriota bacterium]